MKTIEIISNIADLFIFSRHNFLYLNSTSLNLNNYTLEMQLGKLTLVNWLTV